MSGKVHQLDFSNCATTTLDGGSSGGAKDSQESSSSSSSRPGKRKRSAKKKSAFSQNVKKYKRGDGPVSTKGITDKKLKRRLTTQEKQIRDAESLAARAEILLPEEAGFLEADGPMEKTYKFSQQKLQKHVDTATANKVFDLDLAVHGPYRINYSRAGRHLLLGGNDGHTSVMDWSTYSLVNETNHQEKIRDVTFLHNQTMYATAQERYTYIYDQDGVELHCLRHHKQVNRLQFLPYHFLLATVGKAGWLKYQDTSTGQKVAELRTKLGACSVMAQNPWNAVLHLGHHNGTVTLWSPAMSTPLVKMLCHKGPLRDISIDRSGRHMATVGGDGKLKVWDVRTFKQLHSYHAHKATSVDFSQKGLLAVGHGPRVTVWKDACRLDQKAQSPYMSHLLKGKRVEQVSFCPYEDVLGIGHSHGFSSIVIPGSGEANFDSFEANPYATRTQRRETEVHGLLDKLQPDMIALRPDLVGDVSKDTENEIKERQLDRITDLGEKKVILKNKMRGRNKATKRHRRARANIVDAKKQLREFKIADAKKSDQQASKQEERLAAGQTRKSALDRFA